MTSFDYRCSKCGKTIEIDKSPNIDIAIQHIGCGEFKRIFTAPAILAGKLDRNNLAKGSCKC